MFKQPEIGKADLTHELSTGGYPPAQAAKYLSEGRYSKAVELCREYLSEEPRSLSCRIIYALGLFFSKQSESAAEQFYEVPSADPDNVVALKHLGDIEFAEGDEIAAMANYTRILEIDPYCKGLKSDLKDIKNKTTRTITLSRGTESSLIQQPLTIPFYTETIGDLYLAQGHPRLAAEVYRTLNEHNHNQRLAEKLSQAERKIKISDTPKEKDH